MEREVDLNEITDGKKYRSSDLVKIGCNDCKGCSYCCKSMGDTIILDPMDVYSLTKMLNQSFDELVTTSLDLTVVDGQILPNIRIGGESNSCGFLVDGRCSVHDARPGFCRLFPLGRLYENDSFSYILQTKECPYPVKTKVKISKWLGIQDLDRYEAFILDWHHFLKDMQEIVKADGDTENAKNMSLVILKFFYRTPYNTDDDFYSQFYLRLSYFRENITS